MRTLRRARWRLPHRDEVLLGALLTNLCVGTLLVGAAITIAHEFQPEGSPFGRPMRIPTCGQAYVTRPDVTSVYSLAQVDRMAAPGDPVVLEPVIGEIPLFAPFIAPSHADGVAPCGTLIYLHVGADAYAAYGLEGGG